MVNIMNKKILVLCNHNIVLYNFKKELIKALKEEGFDIYISMPFDNSLNYFENELKCKCFETQVDRRGLNPLKDLKLFRKYNHLIKIIKTKIKYKRPCYLGIQIAGSPLTTFVL